MTRYLPFCLALAACTPGDEGPSETDATDSDTDTDGANTTTPSGCEAAYPDHTVGLLQCTPEAAPGYTIFAPNRNEVTYLIDLNGEVVNSWESEYLPGHSVYLLDNGDLLRVAEDNAGLARFAAGGAGGRIEQFDWDGNLVWAYSYATDEHLQHHDIEPLPSGNILLIAWEYKTEAEALAAGRAPGLVDGQGVWADHIIEVDPSTDAIVWEWHLWDHLVQAIDPSAENYSVIADNPGRVDLNQTMPGGFGGSNPDWTHCNGLDYNAALDQIVISSHNLDELWILDHDTTTAEAAGAKGDLLYRWGRPERYGAAGEQQLSGQHDPEWVPAGSPGEGHLIVFNNGVSWGYSSATEIVTPVQADGSYPLAEGAAWGPEAPVWVYEDPGNFYANYISGVQRLPNGNTLICSGPDGYFFEVTEAGDIVWEYVNPVGHSGPVTQGTDTTAAGPSAYSVFRADRYPPDHPAFSGRDLTPAGVIERPL